MSPRDGRMRRVLTRDERELWSTVIRSIKPLRGIAAVEDDRDGAAISESRQARKLLAGPSHTVARPSTPAPPAPLGRRMKQRIARGKETIDARLDLHGLTQAQAHSALLGFLQRASARNARLVLVITGKGGRTEGRGERGVLRRQVPLWLALPEFRAFAIGFEDAHISHGGEGAIYVRVRRARNG